jgi:hypothetical protein
VEQIVLAPASDDHGRAGNEFEPKTEDIGDARNEVERRVGSSAFDGRDMSARDTDRIRQLTLRDIQHGAGIPAEHREGGSKGRRHRTD